MSAKQVTALPPWEKLLQRLHVGDASILPGSREYSLIKLITDTRVDLREMFGKLVLALSRLLSANAVFIVRSTPTSIALVAGTLNRERALNLLESAFIHRLTSARDSVVKTIPVGEKKLRAKYRYAYCLPLGERRNGFQIVLLSQAELSNAENNTMQLIQRVLALRVRISGMAEQLAREAESLSLLTHHLSEGMAVLDANLNVTLWNRPMQRLTGYSPREATGKPYQAVFRRDQEADWLKDLMNIYLSTPLRNVFNREFEIISRDGKRCWVNVSGSFMRQAEDRIVQTILIVRDVTQLKAQEERKNEFISIATHELRTPITAIKGYLSLLSRDETGLTDSQKTYLRRAAEANNRLAGLAEDLLRTVQIEEDRLSINLRPVNLREILNRVTRDLKTKAEGKGIAFSYVPPGFEAWVTADEEKLHQVFTNLIDNALKYTNKGSVRVYLDKFETNGEPRIIVHIQDTGIGISSKNYDVIFEKFRRTHNTAQIRESGAGLGLFIVKSFVEKQGGKISVNSRMGRGTTFSVQFPATENPKPLN
ncbi:MAG: PAS domain S-box protein [Candidatus Berkelbacteria bacterium]|nr:MAG: PAS domain S-box protein [Candidatus Berkelbacteria bacterium]QQG51871.1 MAG: PAS domain S-box protein [Candidatus Berkelbacteria bacterium]